MTALEGRLASVSHLKLAEKAITQHWLPKTVRPFMVYCRDGSMRSFMFKDGSRYHVYNDWRISWDLGGKAYVVSRRGRRSYRTTIKAFAYVYAKSNGTVAK